MRWTRFFNVMFLLSSAVFLIFLGSFGVASAATWTVTSTADTVTAGTLRYAITSASAGDTIDITATGTIVLQSLLPPIKENLTITGPGASKLTISGDKQYKVFTIISGDVNISGLTISDGYVMAPLSPTSGSNVQIGAAVGGGIYNMGTLTVTNCIFSNNKAAIGGGICNAGTLTVTNCTFNGNTADIGGGGIANGRVVINSPVSGNNTTDTYAPGAISPGPVILTVTNCTFSHNTAVEGGGIGGPGTIKVTNCTFSDNTATAGGGIFGVGTLTTANCTFSGNSATALGGGICNTGTSKVTNCTISDNTATEGGGGIYNGLVVGVAIADTLTAPGAPAPVPALDVENTIVANNSGGNCTGTGITSLGYNLEYPAPTTCGFTATGDIVGQDPKLGPLALNLPGTTETFALLAGSPAIDAADPNDFPPTDQRGVMRPQEAGPDIGAYEYAPPTAVPAMDGWGIIVFIILAGLGSVYYLRRRRRAEG